MVQRFPSKWWHQAHVYQYLEYVMDTGLDKPARLIIRLIFESVSDSVFVNSMKTKQILRRQCCLLRTIFWKTSVGEDEPQAVAA